MVSLWLETIKLTREKLGLLSLFHLQFARYQQSDFRPVFGRIKLSNIATIPHRLTPCKLNSPIPKAMPQQYQKQE